MIAFTNGVFDLFHVGHLSTLRYARSLVGCDGCVCVGVNSDESVRRVKGEGRPVIPQLERVEILEALRDVDDVFVFEEDTPYELIKRIDPDFIVKGYDYKFFENQVVGADLAEVKIAPRVHPEVSTSRIIGKIVGLERKNEESTRSR